MNNLMERMKDSSLLNAMYSMSHYLKQIGIGFKKMDLTSISQTLFFL